MKVVVLAGGFGTRLSEYTESIPKPMVSIGGKPILWHIMKSYSYFGHNDFYIALGYKNEVIKEYFLHYRTLNADFTVDLGTGSVTPHQLDEVNWKVTLVDTGLNTMTGGRVKRMKSFIGNETFLLTYGDGLSDVNLEDLLKFHKNHGKLITMTAVRPAAKFGELKLNRDQVSSFEEKPPLTQPSCNCGFSSKLLT
jgi:glucose-1-phosphate cytidylyltransferase